MFVLKRQLIPFGDITPLSVIKNWRISNSIVTGLFGQRGYTNSGLASYTSTELGNVYEGNPHSGYTVVSAYTV